MPALRPVRAGGLAVRYRPRAVRTPIRRGGHRTTQAFLPGLVAGGPQILQPFTTNPTGLVLAAVVLLSIRLERARSEQHWRALRETDIQEEWARYFTEQQIRRQQDETAKAEASKRLQDAQEEAAMQERLRHQEQQILQEKLRREQAATKARQEADKLAFEAREIALQDEIKKREDAVRSARAAEAQQRRVEQERLEQEAQERRRKQEEEANRKAAELRAVQEQQRQEALAVKRALDRLRTPFALRTYGELSAGPAATKPAQATSLQLSCSMSSSAGASPATSASTYDPRDEAITEETLQTVGPSVIAVTQQYETTAQLQQMSGQGPLMILQEPELRHWMRMTQCRTLSAAVTCASTLLQGPRLDKVQSSQKFEVRTERAVLPLGHESRTDALLDHTAALAASGRGEEAAALLRSIMADEEELIAKGAASAPPAGAGQILALVFFLEQAAQGGQSKTEHTALALSVMRDVLSTAAKDTLTPVAEVLGAVIERSHPVLLELQSLAEANMSEAARRQRAERQRLKEARHAAAILEEEYPDAAERKKASAEAREAATPVPERVWALRNVGTTLAMGSNPSEQDRARQMLERAVVLKRNWLEDPRHPGALPELEALRQVLQRRPEWQADAAGLAALQLSLLSAVAERYSSKGDLLSAVVLLEAAVREHELTVGVNNPTLKAMAARAEQLLDALPHEQRQQIAGARRRTDILPLVIQSFEEIVAARQFAATATQKDLWCQGGMQPLPKLL